MTAGPTPEPVSTPVLHQPKPTATQPIDHDSPNAHSNSPVARPTHGMANVGPGDDRATVDVPKIIHSNVAQPGIPWAGLGLRPKVTRTVQAQTEEHWPTVLNPVLRPTQSHRPHPTVHGDDHNGRPIVAGNTVQVVPGILVLGSSTTLAPNDSPITLSGTVVSLKSTALVIGSKTLPLSQSHHMVTDIAGNEATFVPNAIAIAGKTLIPGGSPITTSGTIISAGLSALHFAPTPIALPQSKPLTTNIAGSPATLLSDAVAVAGTTLRPSDPSLTLPGGVLSIGSSVLMIATRTIPIGQLQHTSTSTDTKIYGTPVILAPNGDVVIGDTSLKPGGPGASLDAMPFSMAPNGNIVLDGLTLKPGGAGLNAHGKAFSVASNGELVIGGTTLKPGGGHVAIFPTPTLSISSLVVDGTTITPGGTALTLEHIPISLSSKGVPVVNGTTLRPGATAVTIACLSISLASDGALIANGKTLRSGPLESSASSHETLPLIVAVSKTDVPSLTSSPISLKSQTRGDFKDGPTATSIAAIPASSRETVQGVAVKALSGHSKLTWMLGCVVVVIGII